MPTCISEFFWLTRVKQLSTASITMSIGVVWFATTTLPHFALFCLQKTTNTTTKQ